MCLFPLLSDRHESRDYTIMWQLSPSCVSSLRTVWQEDSEKSDKEGPVCITFHLHLRSLVHTLHLGPGKEDKGTRHDGRK